MNTKPDGTLRSAPAAESAALPVSGSNVLTRGAEVARDGGPRGLEAVVDTGGFVTTYRRAGCGPPVLLILRESAAAHENEGVFATLAKSFRVFHLEMPITGASVFLTGAVDGHGGDLDEATDGHGGGESDGNIPGDAGRGTVADRASNPHRLSVSAWLRTVIDTLGIERAHLVIDESLGTEALAFALIDPARVMRIAILSAWPPDPVIPDRELIGTIGDRGHALLIVRVAGETREAGAVERWTPLVDFLLAERFG